MVGCSHGDPPSGRGKEASVGRDPRRLKCDHGTRTTTIRPFAPSKKAMRTVLIDPLRRRGAAWAARAPQLVSNARELSALPPFKDAAARDSSSFDGKCVRGHDVTRKQLNYNDLHRYENDGQHSLGVADNSAVPNNRRDKLEAFYAQQTWILLTERYPESSEPVLVKMAGGGVMVAKWHAEKSAWSYSPFGIWQVPVSWAPLPPSHRALARGL